MYYVIYNSYAGTYVADIHNNIRRFCIISLAEEFIQEHRCSDVYEVRVNTFDNRTTRKDKMA